MTQYATLNPLGSTSPYDLFDNAQNFDFAINDITNAIWQDRFGRNRQTWYGLEQLAKAAIAAFGYITLDSFQAGATLTLPNQVLRDTSTGEYYRWDGVFPKIVPAGSTPASTGGVSIGAWLSVGDGVLRGNLAAADGSDIVGFGATTVYNSIRRTPQFYGAMGDGVTDDTVALQAAIDNLDVFIPPGIYMFTTLNIPDDCVVNGAGYKQVTLRQIAGTNATAITATASNFELTKFGIDCNYFTSSWNAAAGSLGNTTGNGLEVQGFGFTIDILLNNVAGVGAWFKNPGAENSASRIAVYDISIVGRDFGGEGIIIQGPNDGLLRKAWIGRAGILPRPAAESAAATSSVYSGAQVDGIVIDGANIEIGDVHTYACWSGTGFRTRNTVRLTEGGVL